LLQLDNNVGSFTSCRVNTGQHHVGTLRGERQVILDQHLDILESRCDELGRERGQAAPPGRLLCERSAPTSTDQHLFKQ